MKNIILDGMHFVMKMLTLTKAHFMLNGGYHSMTWPKNAVVKSLVAYNCQILNYNSNGNKEGMTLTLIKLDE